MKDFIVIALGVLLLSVFIILVFIGTADLLETVK